MKRFLFAALALLALACPALAQGPVYCNQSAFYDTNTNGATQMVAAPGGTARIFVCGYNIFSGGTANVSFVYGTGSNCATSQNALTPAYNLIAQAGVPDSSPNWRGLTVPAANALCIKTSAGVAVQAIVYYAVIF